MRNKFQVSDTEEFNTTEEDKENNFVVKFPYSQQCAIQIHSLCCPEPDFNANKFSVILLPLA